MDKKGIVIPPVVPPGTPITESIKNAINWLKDAIGFRPKNSLNAI